MRWQSESWRSEMARLEQWHRWFAWHPICIGEQQVWLESVERKGEFFGFFGGFDPFWAWEYREITQ